MANEHRPADACVLWLHGDDETGAQWERLEADPMSGLGKRLPWVQWGFPTAPGGKWFDYELPIIEASTEYAGIDEAVRTVQAMLGKVEAGGIPSSRILLGGHGPGAALALLAGRTYEQTLAGIACLSGWYMRPRIPSSDKGALAPVLLCHGEGDDEVPIELHTESCARLRRDGVEVSSFSYEGLGHSACAHELTVLAAPKNFITERLRTLTPAAALSRSESVRRAASGGRGAMGGGGHGTSCEAEAPWRHLEGEAAAEVERLTEHLVGGLERLDDGDDDEPSAALARRMIDATEAAQREATSCSLESVSMQEGKLQVGELLTPTPRPSRRLPMPAQAHKPTSQNHRPASSCARRAVNLLPCTLTLTLTLLLSPMASGRWC